ARAHRQRSRGHPASELPRRAAEAAAVRTGGQRRLSRRRTRPHPPRGSGGSGRPRRGRLARTIRALLFLSAALLLIVGLVAGGVLFWATRPGPGQGERVHTRWSGTETPREAA